LADFTSVALLIFALAGTRFHFALKNRSLREFFIGRGAPWPMKIQGGNPGRMP